MIVKDIIEYLDILFPLELQEDWDKSGIQTGNINQSVNKILIALNFDNEVLDKAIANKCDMIITHHPILLETHEDENGLVIYPKTTKSLLDKADTNDIFIYSLHTCLDKGKNHISMNDWLINKFDVNDVQTYDEITVGKKACLNKTMPTSDFLKYVKKVLGLNIVRYSRGVNKSISSIAICGGSGADDIEGLIDQVDCFITGDTKYRHMKYAIDNNILLIDIGHHAEVIMENKLKELLETLDIQVICANSKDYYEYL